MEKSRGDSRFYDHYHQKNQPFKGVIGKNNFTYFYWLQMFSKHLPVLKNLKMLDVGCGVGSLSLYCASQGAKVTGIDISPRAIEIASAAAATNHFTNQPIFLCQPLDDSIGKFDAIICSEVIEHVPDEKSFLHLLFANLKPGGLLLLSTPNQTNWLRKSGWLTKFDVSVGHVRLFNPKTLRELMDTAPATIIDFRPTEGPMRMILFSSFLGNLIRLIKGPLVPLFHYIDHGFARLFGWHDQFIVLKKHE